MILPRKDFEVLFARYEKELRIDVLAVKDEESWETKDPGSIPANSDFYVVASSAFGMRF